MLETDLGLLVIRLAVGLVFAAHGAQKAFGMWGGPGMVGWTGAMEHMGFQPARYWAMGSTAVELVGGIALAIGFLTPIAAAALVGHAIVIILKVHVPKGFWNSKGGFEFPMVLLAGAIGILLIGPGGISIDGLLGFRLFTEAWVKWLGLILAVGGGIGIYLYSVRPEVSDTGS
ncbi:MAG: DoxX family protein [Chloroflexota bacterium]